MSWVRTVLSDRCTVATQSLGIPGAYFSAHVDLLLLILDVKGQNAKSLTTEVGSMQLWIRAFWSSHEGVEVDASSYPSIEPSSGTGPQNGVISEGEDLED